MGETLSAYDRQPRGEASPLNQHLFAVGYRNGCHWLLGTGNKRMSGSSQREVASKATIGAIQLD